MIQEIIRGETMNANIKKTTIAAVATLILAGCADTGFQQQGQGYPSAQSYPSQSYPSQSYPSQSYPPSNTNRGYTTAYGVVDSIQMVQGANTNTGPGLGAVAGAVVGGILGNQVGGGNGRTVATVAGAVGGGLVGNNLENKNRAAGETLYQVGIRLDNGTYQNVTQESASDLRVGSRVRIEGGHAYRY
jgi:outer membrane lipoprotein SlyB